MFSISITKRAADMFSALLVFVLHALPLLTVSSIMLALFELVIIL